MIGSATSRSRPVLAIAARTPLRGLDLDVSLEVPAGECLALAGPSGAGKTTILRIAAGLAEPRAGRVACGETVWLDTDRGIALPPEERRCGFLFQDYALFAHLRAWQNVAYPMRGRPRAERRARARALLERFGAHDLADARPAELSGGERQRVALARALARDPDVLLLDEPLSALDTRTRAAAARELARALAGADIPAILVTHDFGEAAQLGDRVGVVDRGRIVQAGPATELSAAPASPFVADFVGAVVLHGTARRAAGGLTEVALDGGGAVMSTDAGLGRVAATVFPWEISLAPAGAPVSGSALNRLPARVASVTALGPRIRVGLEAPQHLAAEVTATAAQDLGLAPGVAVVASFKATATRIVAA
jgi:molybdate transport system ATP-binding protein